MRVFQRRADKGHSREEKPSMQRPGDENMASLYRSPLARYTVKEEVGQLER